MLVLGIDSSAAASSVCLLKDRAPLSVFSLYTNSEHSVSLLPMIEDTLKRCGKSPEDLDLIASVIGPGSFTGIRIGISVVKGIAFATGIPCIGISSLEAGAYTLADYDGYICPVLDARRNTVYTSLFKSDGKGSVARILEDRIEEVDNIEDNLPDAPVMFIGDAARQVKEKIKNSRIASSTASSVIPWAYGAALCGVARFKKMSDEERRSAAGGDELRPLYLRKTLPERIREEKIRNE